VAGAVTPDREPQPVSADAPASAPGHVAAGDRAASLDAYLLSFQRRAGNRAVGRLLRAEPSRAPRRRAARRALQRRRVPAAATIEDLLTNQTPGGVVDAPGMAGHLAGLERLHRRLDNDLALADKLQIATIASAGLTQPQVAALPERDRELRWYQALLQVRPDLLQGDPLLIDTGPRPGTSDAANLQTLVTNADNVFADIASGARDADVEQIFGTSNLATAKSRYTNGRTWMNNLHAADKIVSDRSGYSREVGLGGLTSFQRQIAVSPGTIDNPANNESVITMIHESMHAGNREVRDFGYITQPSFKVLPETTKLTNAAHYEVVPRRILHAAHDFAGETFTPAGAVGPGGAVTPPLTRRQQAVRNASEVLRAAWNLGLNLHKVYLQVLRNPAQWNTLDLATQFGGVTAGLHFADCLPFWSKVEGMTIHERSGINPTSADPSRRPVTLIDMAISEDVIRRLSLAMRSVPATEADAITLENAHATAAERAAFTPTMIGERDLLIRCIIRSRGEITDLPEDRDLRAVLRMGELSTTWADILQRRNPASFV
jgi:hypothetical protein